MDWIEEVQRQTPVLQEAVAALDRGEVPRACELVRKATQVAHTSFSDSPWWLGRGNVPLLVGLAVKLAAVGERDLARNLIAAHAVFFTHAARGHVRQLVPLFEGDVGATLAFVAHAHGPEISLETFGVQRGQLGDGVLDVLRQEGITAAATFSLLPSLGTAERNLLVQAALRRWPGNAWFWRFVGEAFARAEQLELACRTFERSMRADSLEDPFTDEALLEAFARFEVGLQADGRHAGTGEAAQPAPLHLPAIARAAMMRRRLEGRDAACALVERLRGAASSMDVARAFREAGAVDRAIRVLLAEGIEVPAQRVAMAIEAGRMLLGEGHWFDAVALAQGLAPLEGGAQRWLSLIRNERRLNPRIRSKLDRANAADGIVLDRTVVEQLVRAARPTPDEECGAREAMCSLVGATGDSERSQALRRLEQIGPPAAAVVHEGLPRLSPAVRARIDRLLVAWGWKVAGEQACRGRGVSALQLEQCVPRLVPVPVDDSGKAPLAKSWKEVSDAVEHLEFARAEALAQRLYDQAPIEDADRRGVGAPAGRVVEVAYALAADGRRRAAEHLLIAAAPAFAQGAHAGDGDVWGRCRELLVASAPAALEFALRRSNQPHDLGLGHAPEAVARAAQELIEAKRLSLPDAMRVIEALPSRVLTDVQEATLLAWPTSSALMAVMGLELVKRRRYRLAGLTLHGALEVRELQRRERPEAYAREDGVWWQAQHVQMERQRVLIDMGTADDGAMLVREADLPRGLERATADRPILEIIAVIFAETRGQQAAEEAVIRFGGAESPMAFLLACREIGRLDLAITELERRVAGAEERPARDVLQALVRAYLEAGRHLDAMLVPRVLGKTGRSGAGAVYALLDEEEMEWFPEDDEFPFRQGFGPRVDEAAARQQAIDALLAASVPTAEEEAEAEALVVHIGGDTADVAQAVERLRALGTRAAPVVARQVREGNVKSRATLEPLLEEWAWAAAEAACLEAWARTIVQESP